MNHGDAFLEAIRDEPEEDVHRLAFADWLGERDDQASRDRGEFIRLQCESDRLSDGDPTRVELVAAEDALLARYRYSWAESPFVEWLGHPRRECSNPMGHRFCELMARAGRARIGREAIPAGDARRKRFDRVIDRAGRQISDKYGWGSGTAESPLFEGHVFRRGFVEVAVVVDFMAMLFGKAIFALHPLRVLTVDEPDIFELGDALFDGLIRGLAKGRLRELTIVPPFETIGVLDRFVDSTGVARLGALHVSLTEPINDCIRVLGCSTQLRCLRTLGLSGDGFDDDSLLALMNADGLPLLREVRFDFSESPAFSPRMQDRFRGRFRLVDHRGVELRV